MAIVEMKKIQLVAMNSDRRRLLKAMQKMGCVQIEQYDSDEMSGYMNADTSELEQTEATLTRLDWAIKLLGRFDTAKRGLLAGRDVADDSAIAAAWANQAQYMETVARLEQIEREHADARAEESRIQNQLAQLRPYAPLNEPLEGIGKTRYTMSALGTLDSKLMDGVYAGISEQKLAAQLEAVSQDKTGAHVFAVGVLDDWNALMNLLKQANFTAESFPGMTGTAANNIYLLQNRLKDVGASHKQLDDQTRALCDQLSGMRVLYDVLAMERDQLAASSKFAGTKSAFMTHGWLPADAAEEVKKRLNEIAPSCVIEISDPEDSDNPPTLLRNNKTMAPYESIVEMYSLPDSRGIDPTTVMMPFFVCFFGMMVSDAGYGVIMTIGALLCVKFLKLRGTIGAIAKVLIAGGLATVFWGVLYGGWFGIETPPVMFAPMQEPLLMMILCVGLGFVHLLVGLGVAAYMNVKRGKVFDAVIDQGMWVLILFGLLMLVYAPLAEVGKWMAITGVLGILFFGARDKKGIGRIVSGLGQLYNISGYLSDLLSYARLFGMGLATGVIGMVINLVASMMWGNPVTSIFSVIIFIGGHTFNLLINALGAYVHSCRLQYIEFFGKFYEAGGHEFKPLRVKPKYVDINQSAA